MSARAWLGAGLAVALLWRLPACGQTLTDALVSAYKSNPKLLSQRAQLKVTDENVAQVQANWRPTISVQASDSYVNDRITGADTGANSLAAQAYLRNEYPGDSYGLSLSQPVFRGFRTINQTRQAHAEVHQGEAQLLSVEEQVMLAVITDYLDLSRDQALLELATRRETDARSQLAGAQDKLKGGETTRIDVATAVAAVQDAWSAHQQAASQELTSRLLFARDSGLEPHRLAPVDGPAGLPPSLGAAADLAGAANFDVRMAEYAVRAAQAALEVAKGAGLPTVSIQGTLLHQDGVTLPGEAEDLEAASIQLKMPIYSGGMLSSQTRAARATVEVKRDTLDDSRRTAEAQAGAAYAQLDFAAKAVAGLQVKASALTTSLEGSRRQQSAGDRTLSDIITAEEALFAVQIAQVQARHDLQLAQYTLADTVGELTAEQLHLPVDLYDPEKYLRKIAWGPGR